MTSKPVTVEVRGGNCSPNAIVFEMTAAEWQAARWTDAP
jgi:hypothetical protein